MSAAEVEAFRPEAVTTSRELKGVVSPADSRPKSRYLKASVCDRSESEDAPFSLRDPSCCQASKRAVAKKAPVDQSQITIDDTALELYDFGDLQCCQVPRSSTQHSLRGGQSFDKRMMVNDLAEYMQERSGNIV